ncbi:unnamed protein product, partial [Chondrus crispus]
PDLPDLRGRELHDKAIGCMAIAPNSVTMATGSEDGFVRLFSIKSPAGEELAVAAEFVEACARFGGPVRALDFSPTGAFLAAGGDEPGVLKIIMTAQTSNVTILRAPAAGMGNDAISSVAFDPTGDFVATIGEKGKAVIWDVEKCKLISEVDLNNRTANCLSWAPGGGSIVFGTNKGIVVAARTTWLFDHLLEDTADQDDDDDEIYAASSGKDSVSALAWSPNGRYLLAAKEDASISLWDVPVKKVLGCWKAQEAPQRLLWHPAVNAMLFIDKIGQWGIVPDVVPQHMLSPHSDAPSVELPVLPETNGKQNAKDIMADLGDDDDDGTGDVRRSKGAKLRRQMQQERKKKTQTGKANKNKKNKKKGMNAEATDDDENDFETDFQFNASDVEADDEDDVRDRNEDTSESEGASESDEEIPGEFAGLENGGVRLPRRKSRSSSGGRRRRSRSSFVRQRPFVPTSTPLLEKKNKKRHILAWNLVGAVLSFDEGSHDVVEIEFSDATKRSVGIKDHFGYTMGCLSETGVLLASPKKAEHGSLITFRPFSSWSNNSDWTQFLPADEDISVVALGQRFAAVATTPNNVVRLFSLTGIQTSTFGAPGTVISMAASGDQLAVVYASRESPVLMCELLDVSTLGDVEKLCFSGNMMMCPDTRLEWVGFAADSGDLCSYDSNGWLWMLTDPKGGKRWVPLMQNAAKAAECDWFWVASATSSNLIGVPCLSNERHPPAKPRPALRTLPLSYPVIEQVSKSGKATITERYLRTKLQLRRALSAKAEVDEGADSDDPDADAAEDVVRRMEVETDKCVLPLMEEACRTEHNMRGLDLATRLHTKVSFKYAIELATHFKREALATRVKQVALRKMEVMDTVQSGERVPHVQKRVASSPVTPAPEGPRVVEKGANALPEVDMGDISDDEEEPLRRGAGESEGPEEAEGEVEGTEEAEGAEEAEEAEEEEKAKKRKPVEKRGSLAKEVEERAARKRKLRAIEMSQASVKGAGPGGKRAKTAEGSAKKRPRNRFLKR